MNQTKIAAIFLTGVAVGGIGTYWAVTSHTKKKYEAILDTEIAQVKEHYRVIHKKDSYDTPEDLLAERLEKESAKEEKAEYLERVSAYEIDGERGEVTKDRVETRVDRSIFDYSQLGNTKEASVSDKAAAYPISYEEFDGENPHYTKTTLTYYKPDETVADEMDDVIQDVDSTLGPEGLTSFGKIDPNNPDTTYIRNDVLKVDYEVIIEERSYREVVIGE